MERWVRFHWQKNFQYSDFVQKQFSVWIKKNSYISKHETKKRIKETMSCDIKETQGQDKQQIQITTTNNHDENLILIFSKPFNNQVKIVPYKT